MELLAPFVERRSQARLRETPLRRRSHVVKPTARQERRQMGSGSIDIPGIIELNLDRYPTKAAMLTYLQSLLYAAEASHMGALQLDYVVALRKAIDALADSPGPLEAAATLQGYRRYLDADYVLGDDAPAST